MSELEHCRLAHEGKLDELINKIESSAKVEDLVKKKDQSGRTALHWASAGGRQDIVKYLYETYNVPLDDPDDSGWTPLMISASAGSFDLVKFFLENGCDPNSENQNKQRALHYAASKNFPQIASILLEKGAECNAADVYGNTALHRACSKGNHKIADILLTQYKANANQPDCEGNTSLHLACEEQRIEIAKFLLKHGANPHAKNKEGKTPIDLSMGGLQNLL